MKSQIKILLGCNIVSFAVAFFSVVNKPRQEPRIWNMTCHCTNCLSTDLQFTIIMEILIVPFLENDIYSIPWYLIKITIQNQFTDIDIWYWQEYNRIINVNLPTTSHNVAEIGTIIFFMSHDHSRSWSLGSTKYEPRSLMIGKWSWMIADHIQITLSLV